MRPTVVITGVSTGIGFDAARLLIERGYRVFGSVRTQLDAGRVGAVLGPEFTPLLFDVTDEAAIAAAVRRVADVTGDEGLCALVNNAGVSGAGPLMLGARRDCPHPPGRIINISSHFPLVELRNMFEVKKSVPVSGVALGPMTRTDTNGGGRDARHPWLERRGNTGAVQDAGMPHSW